MKIIAGKFKGRNIPIVKNATYRPSTSKFKEAVFSILISMNPDIWKGTYVLDLFSGTGGLGFEALSRGAAHVTLVDIEPRHIKTTIAFAEELDLMHNITCLCLDATNLPTSHFQYNVVFIDPPYMQTMAQKALHSLHDKQWIKNGALVIIELSRKEDIVIPNCYETLYNRLYSSTRLMILSYR